MGRNSVESIIEDFIKGARQGGFKGHIQVQRDGEGRSEQKLANFGGGMPPGMAGGMPPGMGGGMPPGMGGGGGMPQGGGDMGGGIEQLIAAHPELLQLFLAQLGGSPMGGGEGMPPEMGAGGGGGMPPGLDGGGAGGGGGMPPGLDGGGGGDGPPKEKKDKKESKGGDDGEKKPKDKKEPPKKEHNDGDGDDKCANLYDAYNTGVSSAFQKFGFLQPLLSMGAGALATKIPAVARMGTMGQTLASGAASMGADAMMSHMRRPPGP